MPLATSAHRARFGSYRSSRSTRPLFIRGDARSVLAELPDAAVDCCMTSPPYWGHRTYESGGIGSEGTPQAYMAHLLAVIAEIRRVLKPTGSLWLNVGDAYVRKSLAGIPWRLAIGMIDDQRWILRNEVIWDKVKGGPDHAPDKLRNVHEHLFHFVPRARGYYYDADAIRSAPRRSRVVHGAVVSATGVSGVRYRRQIELSTALNDREKNRALRALDMMLQAVGRGEVADFRMIIRGQQRVTHSDSEAVSGRARELGENGFYFLRYHPNGQKPPDVWSILPEDTHRRDLHFSPYPEDLCRTPIAATCPLGGIVLDPFCGTGTTMRVAMDLGRKSVGIDISAAYLSLAHQRCTGRRERHA